MNPTSHARRSRRFRSRLSRVLALAVAGPLIMGSLAYAARVGPVRRHVNEFLKGTASLFHRAESSTGDFHVSPNPIGRGVFVMPIDDRGPRPLSENSSEHDSDNAKEEKSSAGSHVPGQGTELATAAPKNEKSNSVSGGTEETKESKNADDSEESEPGLGSDEGAAEPSDHHVSESDDDHSGKESGHHGDDDRSGSGHSHGDDYESGEWDSDSEEED